MNETSIDYGEVELCISRLRMISTEYLAKEKTELGGEGCTIYEIENIAKLYEVFYTNVNELVNYTIVFLEKFLLELNEQDQPK